jgi:hypothetical protein
VGGEAEMVEDVQSLLPGVAGRVEIADGMVAVGKVGEGCGLAMAVAEFPLQWEELLVVGDGLFVLAEKAVSVSNMGQSVGLSPSVAEFSAQDCWQ